MIPDDIHAPCASEMARLTKERDEARAELADARRGEAAVREALLRFSKPGRRCFCTPPPSARGQLGRAKETHSDRCVQARKALAGELASEGGT